MEYVLRSVRFNVESLVNCEAFVKVRYLQRLKGQSHEIFFSLFFPQTAPPGPIRDVQGPF